MDLNGHEAGNGGNSQGKSKGHRVSSTRQIASSPKTTARFKREIDLALRVTHHNVCRVYDLERHRLPEGSGKPEVVFLTMELLEGETLADRLRRQGRMGCQGAVPLVRQMAEGLAAAHRNTWCTATSSRATTCW